jgi:glycosyltransferase involved in cell wall biosynthesis
MAERAFIQAGLGAVLPRQPVPGRREIGFVLPVFEFGGVEKVVLNLAAVIRASGWGTHLLVAGARHMELFAGTTEAFDSINLFAGFGEEQMDWQEGYFGAGVSRFQHRKEAADVLGLLGGLEVVVNTHAMAGHALMAQLRRQGTRTYAGLHLVERGPWANPIGNPQIALAYEHAYDGLLVISEQLRDWCIGQGIPPAKLHLVRNAASYPVARRTVAATLAGRAGRGGPLRALFLGRLDAQKGLDRLAAIIAATRDGVGPEAVEWRVVGRTIFLDEVAPELGVPVEPPALSPAALDALYAWADVVVLPSRFEGVPLTVLEAQRLGCVPLATDVGAVAEIIAEAEDGFLVHHAQPEVRIVAAFVTRLKRLAADRALLGAVGQRAAARLARQGWHANLAPFMAHLDTLFPPEAVR